MRAQSILGTRSIVCGSGVAKYLVAILSLIPGRSERRPLMTSPRPCGVVDRGWTISISSFTQERDHDSSRITTAMQQLSPCRCFISTRGQCLFPKTCAPMQLTALLRYLRAARSCLWLKPPQSQATTAAATLHDGRCGLAWDCHMRPPPTLVGDRRNCRACCCPERRKTSPAAPAVFMYGKLCQKMYKTWLIPLGESSSMVPGYA
ncbi:hypothetical protein BKA81DRAFT_75373 [Phyllosticta paracitricarpa]|uniref:Uncharacterized protein n=2 Tax=Phyllosticta TaxID=121621 RepID=A0ABR1M5Q5_9PEZI